MTRSDITKFAKGIAAYFITLVLYMAVVRHTLFLVINHVHMDTGCGAPEVISAIGHGLMLDSFAACYLSIVPFFLMAAHMLKPSFSPCRWMAVYNTLISIAVPLAILANASLFYFWDSLLDVSALTFLNDPATAFASVSTGYMVGRFAIWMVLSAVMYGALRWSERWCAPTGRTTGRPRPVAAAATTLVAAGLIFMGIRGLGTRPMSPTDAFFSNDMFCNHMTVNPVMNMIFSATHTVDLVKKYHSMPDDECDAAVACMLPQPGGETEMLLSTDAPDILLIITESLSASTLPSLCPGDKLAVAAGLDSLAATGVLFTRQYCDSYQTDQAIPGLLNGVHVLAKIRPFREEPRMKRLPSLARRLAEAGYTSEFVYGGDANYMNMYSYLVYSGYDKIVSGADFPASEATSRWGIPDGVMLDHLYDIMLEDRAGGEGRHFYTLLTLSSHNPFDVPVQRVYDDPAQNAYAYTDRSLTDFVNRLSRTDLWGNLLIIITGDHGPHEHAKATPGYSHTVLMMLGGAIKEPRRIDTIISQHDLPATLLAQMGLEHGDFAMSRNVMSDAYAYPSAINTFDDGFTFIDDTGITVYDNARMAPVSGDDARRIANAKAYQQHAAGYFESLK